jgi:hypothetical protein
MIFSAEPGVINPGFEIPVQPGVETNLVEPVPAEGLTPEGPELVPVPENSTTDSTSTGSTPK